LDERGVEQLADRVGVGERHLRRLFAEHLGAAPLAVAQSRRVHFAKRMIEETAVPMYRVALASGYHNVRRFNAAIRRCFDRTPSEIRKHAHARGLPTNGGTVELRLSYREPFDWNGLLGWMAARAVSGVEQVDGRTYRRTAELDDFRGMIELTPAEAGRPALVLRAPVDAAPVLARMAERARALFDLDADPVAIHAQLGSDPGLAAIARRYPGARIPGCWDRFELAVRAVLGQQVSVAGASTMAGRLAEGFGRPVAVHASSTSSPRRLFPRPEDLADADLETVGVTASRARTVRSLARAVCDGEPILDLAPDLETALGRLTALRGIGDWTASYIAMRALREPDAFPAGDLGLRKALANERGELPSAAELEQRAEVWRPWRAYAAMLLWRSPAATTMRKRS
jgi:AraC family transcriptional regulator of adaptative response / DNA-3-methyladenine glycosylase II